jgi:hypothetical protein
MSQLPLAKTLVRLLPFEPGLDVALAIADAELASAVSSLLNSAGAKPYEVTAANASDLAPAGIIAFAPAPSPLVHPETRAAIARIVPGGTVVLAITGAASKPEVVGACTRG